ncbi:MAG: hypothetical protein N5P05_003780 [Chroococcopsis gigantea SAG 12.99]|jgi:hypothetical protein|nr:hypothetical protein [Chlorogloea purpurea SAG 13.99]MDV3002174.1 hypothetical protein [Chroococcopsis gigantea SAG 12.99]
MERGLLWLPLLIVFIGLAWSGWNEYQKVEAYRLWAQGFDRAKYDIYSVLGQKGDSITWGKPTRKGPINLQTFSLKDVAEIRLVVDGEPVNPEALPPKGKAGIMFIGGDKTVTIPFTEIDLAARWAEALKIPL